MFVLYANKNLLIVRKSEAVTSGSVNVYKARFEFSEDWDGLSRTAVFKAGKNAVNVLLDESGVCTVPHEVLETPHVQLMAGVYGKKWDDVVLPTIWAELQTILVGAEPGAGAQPPTPDLWQQELAQKQDKLTGLSGQVVGFDEEGNAVAQDVTGGGSGGTTDHRELTHRSDPSQHPIDAIDGLREAVESIPAPVERITNSELEELLK